MGLRKAGEEIPTSLNCVLLGLHLGISAGDSELLPLFDRVSLRDQEGKPQGPKLRLSAIAQEQNGYT